MPSEFTPNNVWGGSAAIDEEQELTLPSGQTCLARRVSIESMLTAGILSDVDSLTAMVAKYTREVKGGNGTKDGTPVIDNSLLSDANAMKAMVLMVDKALPHIVVSPPVALHMSERKVGNTTVTKRLTEEERTKARQERNQPNLVFTDQVDFGDKMHLFEWSVGGLKSFMSFRAGSSPDVGSVGTVASNKKSAKSKPRGK